MSKESSGHRQNLRKQFINQDIGTLNDDRILELLLTYAIPQKDVYPLACELINKFGSLKGVLSADLALLLEQKGIKEYSAVLIKLADWIRTKHPSTLYDNIGISESFYDTGEGKIDINLPEQGVSLAKQPKKRSGTGLFGKAMMGDTIKMLPMLPDTDSIDETKEFLKMNLPFNSEQTRYRNTLYIVQRMFPYGISDKSLRLFARHFAGTQELKDVCYYRFCKVEALMERITEHVLLPVIANGAIKRNTLTDYLQDQYPQSKSIKDCVNAITEAWSAAGIARCTKNSISFTYRRINPAAFAFILYSEFPDPGLYDIGLLERSNAVNLMLWEPEGILPALYELRNRGLLSKVSQIDSVRQFTTQYNLEQVVLKLIAGEGD